MTDTDNDYFQQTLGRELGHSLEGEVDFELLSNDMVLGVLYKELGFDFSIDDIKTINEAEFAAFAAKFNSYYKVKGITKDMISKAFKEAIWHWEE